MDLPRRYSYELSWKTDFVLIVIFSACTVIMGGKAALNSGLITDHVVSHGWTIDVVRSWTAAALSACFVVLWVVLALNRIANPKAVELGTDSLVLPHGPFFARTARIAYVDIEDVSEGKKEGCTVLYITARGVKYMVMARRFPDAESYTTFRDFLVSHLPTPRKSARRGENQL